MLHHIRRGRGEPMLLLHGVGLHAGIWEPVLDRLAEHHDVVAVDLPGFGRSPTLRTGKHDVDGLTHGVLVHMDELGWERAHLVGNSLGGLVALELARRGRARTVVAISPAGGARGWEDPYARFVLWNLRLGAKLVAPVADRLAHTAIGRFVLGGLWTARPTRAEPAWLAAAARNYAAAEAFETVAEEIDVGRVLARYTQLDVRVRIVWGTRDTLLLPRQAHRFVDKIPDADLEMLDGLGHTPMSDDPRAVARAILEVTSP